MQRILGVVGLLFFLVTCSDDHQNQDAISATQSPNFTTSKTNAATEYTVEELDTDIIYNDDIFIGDKNCPVKVIFFFSTTCPACSYFFRTIVPKLKSEFVDTKQIILIFREAISSQKELLASILARSMDNTDDYINIMNIILENQREWVLSKNYYEFFSKIAKTYSKDNSYFEKHLHDKNLRHSLFSKSFSMYKKFPTGYIPVFIIGGEIFDMKQYKNYQSLEQEILKKTKHLAKKKFY